MHRKLRRRSVSGGDALLTAAVLATLAAHASAQVQLAALPAYRLPQFGSRDVTLGDVDGDGDLDIVTADSLPKGRNRLYLDDGNGGYVDVTTTNMPTPRADARTIALGDLDGDGDLDMVVAEDGQSTLLANPIYINDGTGAYTQARNPFKTVVLGDTRDIAIGDVDGDGDLDIVFGNNYSELFLLPQYNSLYLNNGDGGFVLSNQKMPGLRDFTTAVALGDVDGDGDLDLVTGNGIGGYYQTGSPNELYLNDGTGTFTDVTRSALPSGNNDTAALALGDVDGDGDLDIVVANSTPYPDRLLVNDGGGHFTEVTATQLPAANPSSVSDSVALGDLDGDGDLDLLFAAYPTNRLYVNDGTGTFTDVSGRLPAESGSDAALGDLDGDGDVDVVIARSSAQDLAYANLLRQVDVPGELHLGQGFTIDAYRRYGPASSTVVALPFVATATASIPLPPLGTVGLDPTQTIALPAFVIPQPAGKGSLPLTMPNLPALVGAAIHAQALVQPLPMLGHLTNVTSNPVFQ